MKTTHLVTRLAVWGVAAMFSACSEDLPYSNPVNEQYTRAFIKEFGLIDPAQDWNLAQNTQVTVNVGTGATQVRVYAKSGDTYYLTADLVKLSGKVDIPVDIPEGCNDLLVKVDGRKYHCAPGGTVDASLVRSRGPVTDETNAKFTHKGVPYDVTISGGYATGDAEYYYFNAQQMGPLLAPVIPVDYDGTTSITDAANTDGDGNYYWGDYYSLSSTRPGMIVNPRTSIGGLVSEHYDNVGTANVFQDIRVTPDPDEDLVVYPMYWFTDDTHHLGVYLIDDDDQPVCDTDGNIITFPVYTQKKYNAAGATAPWDIEYYNKGAAPSTGVEEDEVTLRQTVMPSGMATDWYENGSLKYKLDPSLLTNFVTAYNNYYQAGGDMGSLYDMTDSWTPTPAPNKDHYEITAIADKGSNSSHYSVEITFTRKADVGGDSGSGTTVPYALDLDGSGTWTKPETSDTRCCYQFRNQMLMRSHGININIDGWPGKIGFCTTINGGKTIYSQAQVNIDEAEAGNNIGFNNTSHASSDKDSKLYSYNYSYAAFYFHPVTKTPFYSFEDWTGGGGDADLNDMVFMVKGIDHVDSDKGEIPVKVTTESTTDQTLSWIVAAEDLGAMDDFDFNDLIFKLSSITTNHTIYYNEYGDIEQTLELASTVTSEIRKEIRIQAMAAGGTKKLWLHFSDGTNDYILGPDKVVLNDGTNDVEDCEWHQWFGVHPGTMVNTGMTLVAKPATCVLGAFTSTTEIENGAEGSPTTDTDGLWNEALNSFSVETYFQSTKNGTIQGFYLTVDTPASGSNLESIGDNKIVPADKGAAPQMFLIPDIGVTVVDGENSVTHPWSWTKERTHIASAYPRFREWVKSSASNADWHKDTPVSGTVIRPVD